MKRFRMSVAFFAAVSVILSTLFIMPTVMAQSANLAQGCEVKATAQLSDYDIKRVIDGETAANASSGKTAITSFDTSGFGFYELSFDAPKTVDLVKLYFNQIEPKQRPKDIAVDIRRADGVYVRMAEMHAIDYNIKSNGYGGLNELYFSFSPVECVAIRITGNRQRTRDANNEPTANYNFRLMEIEIFSDSDIAPENYTGVYDDENSLYNIPVPDPILDNLIGGCTVESTQQLSNYDIARLTNGFKKLSSDCAITSFNTANLSSYEVILAEETELNQVRLYFSSYEVKYRPMDIAIDLRLANGVYIRAAELHNIDYKILGSNSAQVNVLDFKFENKKAVAIRIIGNRQRTRVVNNSLSASYNFRLVEAEAYLNATLTAEDYSGVTPDENEAYNIPVTDPILTNLAQGKPVTASDELTAGNVTYSASHLTDGNNSYTAGTETNAITKWNSATKTAYFEIDFEETVLINRTIVFLTKWQKEYLPPDIAVDVRLANGTYKRVAEMHNISFSTKEKLTFSFEEVNAVALRVTGNCSRNTNSENFRLMEIEAYYYPDMPQEYITGTDKDSNNAYNIPVPDPILTNVAQGKPVVASDELTAGNVTYSASHLTDGNSSYTAGTETNAITKWNSVAKTAYFEIDLEQPVLINRALIFLTQWQRDYLPLDMAVDVRLANGVYKRVAEMHNISYTGKKYIAFHFEDAEAVAVRITGNCARNEASENFRLMEVDISYYPDMPAELLTGTVKDENDAYNIPVPDPILPNLAAGKKATANEIITAGKVTYEANHLTDGNTDYTAGTETNAITKWNKKTKLGYFEIELDGEEKINRTTVYLTQWQKESLPKEMAIDVRLSNGVYKRVAEMHDISFSGKKYITFSFETIDATAVRVTGNCARNESSENFRLMEIEVSYYPDMPAELLTGTERDENEDYNIPVPDPILENLASGKKVTANETLSVKDVTYDANLLTDGNRDYYTGTNKTAITRLDATTNSGWFEVEFGNVTKFNRVAVFLSQWEKNILPKDLAVDIRLSNGVYKRVAEMHNIDYTDVKQLTLSFEEISALAFRLTGNFSRNSSSNNFRLVELEAYYYPDMPKEQITGVNPDLNNEYNIPIPDPLMKNLALGMKATANDELVANHITYSASRLTDGYTKYNCKTSTDYTAITRWISKKKLGWYEVTFNEPTKLNRVVVCLSQWEKKFLPLDMAVEVKLPTGEYVLVAVMHNIDYTGRQKLIFDFPEQTGVAFRVIGNANRNKSSDNFRLIELQAYYWPGMPEANFTGTNKDPNSLYNFNDADLIVVPKNKKTKEKKSKSGNVSGYTLPDNIGTTSPVSVSGNEAANVDYYMILFIVAAGFLAFAFTGGTVFLLFLANKRFKK